MPKFGVQSFKKILCSFFLILCSFSWIVSPVYAAPVTCTAANPCPANLTDVENLVSGFLVLIVPAAFVALLVMLTWAGVKFLTSGGEHEAIKSARSTATWAVVGILFLVIAWLALVLVQNFVNVNPNKPAINLLHFCIQFNGCPTPPP